MPVISPSTGFIDAIRFGATLVQARLTVYTAGAPTEYIVPISTMQITVDRNSAQRRSGNLTAEVNPTIPPPVYVPTNPNSLLTPFGNEVFVEFGIGTANTANEIEVAQWVPCGLFPITTSTVADTGLDMTLTLEVYDRSWIISQRQFIQPYNFPNTPSGNFTAEIEFLLTFVWGTNQATNLPIPNTPPLVFNPSLVSQVVPTASYDQGSDPWQAAQDMANAVGFELFYDVYGQVTWLVPPVPSAQPIVWNFTDDASAIFGAGGAESGGGSTQLLGSPYSTPAATSNIFTRDGIYNDVYITGTGTSNAPDSTTGSDAPVLAEAADVSPVGVSATSIYGPIGDIPEFVSSNLTTSGQQATQAAVSDALTALTSAWQIELSISPNPIFDVDDVVTVTRARMGLSNVSMILDTMNYVVSYADLSTLTGRVIQPGQVVGTP